MVMIFDKRLFMNLAAASVSFSPLSPHTPSPLPMVHKRVVYQIHDHMNHIAINAQAWREWKISIDIAAPKAQ